MEEKIKMRTIRRWCGRRSWMTSHLGTNPRRGGRPAWERRMRVVGILREWGEATRAVRSIGD